VAYNGNSESDTSREVQMLQFVTMDVRVAKSAPTCIRTYSGFAQIAANTGAILNIVFQTLHCTVFLLSKMEFSARLVKNMIYTHTKGEKDQSKMTHIRLTEQPVKKTVQNHEESNLNLLNGPKLTTPNNILLTDNKSMLTNPDNKTGKPSNMQDGLIALNLLGGKKMNTSNGSGGKTLSTMSLLNYQFELNVFELAFMAMCPCSNLVGRKYGNDMEILEFSRKHIFKYTDFFTFIDKIIEFSIFKKMILSKDESDAIDLIKRTVVVRDHDILNQVRENQVITKKLTMGNKEEKLRNYVGSILQKDHRSTFEQNYLENVAL
jgi:hypothetical protein